MTELPDRPTFPVPAATLRQVVAEQNAELLADIAARPWTFGTAGAIMRGALDTAAVRAAIDPSDRMIGVDLERVACASAAVFGALAAGRGGAVEAPLPHVDDTVTVAGVAPAPDVADPIEWRTGLFAAMCVRKRRAINILVSVPLDVLVRLAPHDPAWAQKERAALRALAGRHADAGDLLVEAAREADPDTVGPAARDWVLDIVTPELAIALNALARDQAGVDTWTIEAIKGHHHYYAVRPDRTKTMQAQLALAPLAMVCVAHDLGVPTTIVSPYLPRHILR